MATTLGRDVIEAMRRASRNENRRYKDAEKRTGIIGQRINGRPPVTFCDKHQIEKIWKEMPSSKRYVCLDCNRERERIRNGLSPVAEPRKSRQDMALELSDKGCTIQEVAEQLGCTVHQASDARARAALADNRREKQDRPGASAAPYYLDAMDKKAEEVWARKVDPAYYGVRAVWHSSAIRDMEIGL